LAPTLLTPEQLADMAPSLAAAWLAKIPTDGIILSLPELRNWVACVRAI
jgi:hypothetical protein